MSEQWYCSIGGKVVGPVSAAQLQQMAYQGQLSETDLVWKQGFSDWVPFGEAKGLFAAVNPYMPSAVAISIPAASIRYAGFWKRFAAFFIDGIVLALGGVVVAGVLGFVMYEEMVKRSLLWEYDARVTGITLGWLYFTGMESSPTQGTLGKMALRIKVTDLDGNRVGFRRATGRHFAEIYLC